MSISYENVLKRLKEERNNKCWSQADMGKIMRMSQSHYSKAEQGKCRFSFYEIQCLCESDIDSYYIFTGKRCERRYGAFFEDCSYDELVCFINIIYCAIEFSYINTPNNCLPTIKGLRSSIPIGKNNTNFFYILRMSMNCNQKKMAEMLSVDIKKLRDLEKGKVLPDSEIIWKMYCIYKIPHSLIVKSKVDIIYTINNLLDDLGKNYRDIVFRYIKEIHFAKS